MELPGTPDPGTAVQAAGERPAPAPRPPPTPYQAFRATRVFGSLDGLRACSIVPVVWHHAAGVVFGGLFALGNSGVQLFFAISGFLITTLLLREQGRTGTVSLRNFYARRSLRIFPLYYAVLSTYVGLVLLVDRHSEAGAQFFANLPAFLTYTSNWFVDLGQGERVIFYFAWSLATEEQFYLVWPSVVRFMPRRWMPAAFMVALLAAGEGARIGIDLGVLDAAVLPVKMLSCVATPICLGGLSAIALDRPAGFARLYRVVGRRWSAPVAALLVVASVMLQVGFVTAVAMTALVLSVVVRSDHGLRRILELRPMVYVGTISYGMYMLHMLAVNVARRVVDRLGVEGPRPVSLVVFLVALPLTVGIAAFSHRYFEAWFLRLKSRFESGKDEPVRGVQHEIGGVRPVVAGAGDPGGVAGV